MYWLYWESINNKIPHNIKILLHIFRKKLKNIRIVTDKTIHKYIKTVDTRHLRHIAQKADYYRAKILYTHGGIWLDIDTIMLENIDYLYEALNKSDKQVCISTSELANNNVCLQYLISKPRSEIFKLWYLEIEKIINSKKLLPYAFFGNLLASIINKHNLIHTILPFPNEITFRFGHKNVPKYYNTDNTFIINTMESIKNNEKKMIILYGSGEFYTKKINKNTILYHMLEYAYNH